MKILKGGASSPAPADLLILSTVDAHARGAHATHTRAPHYTAGHHSTVSIQYSLQLDLDYLESTCNAHIRRATEDVFRVTMAGTCSLRLKRDTPKKITVLKKQSSREYT